MVKEIFISVIGNDFVTLLEQKNWVQFSVCPDTYYGETLVQIEFLKTDWDNSTIIFTTLIYNKVTNTLQWVANIGPGFSDEFDSFSEAMVYYNNEIRCNTKNTINF